MTNVVYSANPILDRRFKKNPYFSPWVKSKARSCVENEVMYTFYNNHVNSETSPMLSIVLAKFVMVLFLDANAH